MTATYSVREEELGPRASVLIESLRDIGYSLPTAIADVVDNSIAAGARRIDIFAKTHSRTPAIGILDDGSGMTRSELLEAMRLGTRSSLDVRSASDLGRFGLGLKTASFSQCRRLTVLTRKNGIASNATWDLDSVAERDKWIVEIPDNFDGVPWSESLTSDGTLIVWQKLDRLVGRADPADQEDLVRQLAEVADHIEFVFHRFLSGKERPNSKVRMFLNRRELNPFDPFNSNHPATQRAPDEVIRLRGKEIRIRPVTLPHHDKVSQEEWRRLAGREGYVKNQGFYLYRNRRLIIHGTWFGITRQTELTKLSRVLIDLPNDLDADWKIDVKKASAQPPPPVRRRLRQLLERIGAASKRTYIGRVARLTSDNRLPVWNRYQNKNRISYGLNLEHPTFATFLARLDKQSAKEFRTLISLIAATLPIDALYKDVSENAESVETEKLSPEELSQLVKSVWRVFQAGHVSRSGIRKRLQSAYPFRTDWEVTERLITLLEEEET